MQIQAGYQDFIHPVLNEGVRTISGRYMLSSENRLSFNGREVFYLIGCAVVDSSCCAPAGCAYALVPGYILQWKYKRSKANLPVTQVEPIKDPDAQAEIRHMIQEKECVQQVNFE